MFTLAQWHDGAGPGPWILLFPLIWAGVVLLLRRTAWRVRRGPWHRTAGLPQPENSPVSLLGRRFAEGEIDEDEYWRRISVLRESARPYGHGDGTA